MVEVVDDGIGRRGHRARAPVCAGSPTGSRRSAAGCGCGARPAAAPGCGRRCRARSDRRGQRAAARGAGAAAQRRRLEVVAQCGDAEELRWATATRPRSRSSTSGCRRRTATRGCGRRSRSARAHPGDRRAGALPVRRARARDEAARRLRRGRRLPAQGPDQRRGRVRRRGAAGRRRRLRDRSDDRLDAALADGAATIRSAELTPREREVLELMATGTPTRGSPTSW